MFQISCLNPQLLVNKSAIKYFSLGYDIYVKGIRQTEFSHSSIKSLLKSAANFNDVELDDSYISFPRGFRLPLFFYAPCRHCSLCRSKRQKELISLACIEESKYSSPTYFFTLTYRPQDLPVNYGFSQGQLRYKDVQDFFKRLRKRFKSNGLNTNFTYLVSGEYGSRFHRPHYHVLLFNNPYGAHELNPLLHNKLKSDIFESWKHSDINGFDFGQCRGNAAAYAVKYVSKDSCLPSNAFVKPFIRHSINFGYRSDLYDVLHNSNTNIIPYVQQDGTPKQSFFSSYLSSKYHPSPFKQVPSTVYSKWIALQESAFRLVSLDSLQYDFVSDCLDSVMPYRSVLSVGTKFPSKRDFPFKRRCTTFINLFYPRFYIDFQKCLSSVSEHTNEDLTSDALFDYLFYINSLPSSSISDVATHSFKILDKEQVILGKCSL